MSLTQKEFNRFYALKPKPVIKVKVGGNVHFANFPNDIQKQISDKLAEKDPIMMKAIETTKFGIKIDGQEVGRDNIHDFEIKKPGEISKAGKAYKEKHKSEIDKILKGKKEVKKVKKVAKPEFSESQLFALSKKEQISMLKGMGITKIPRLEKGRVKKILELIGGSE